MELLENNIELIFILGAIQILCCVAMLIWGFKKPEEEEELKPIEFDWKKEGF